MTREEFQTERTRIISEMLDNPDEYGIYPTTKCFEQLDALYDSLSLPPAEGAENIRQLLLGWEHYKRDHFRESEALDVEAILMSEYSQIAAQQHPTAEGAEAFLDEIELGEPLQTGEFYYRSEVLEAMNNFATFHAQRIADKMKEANQFILDIAGVLGIETDGVGFDGLTLSIDDFKEAADKMVAENLVEFGNMIRDEPNGDIAALAEYFIRAINLKTREK